jgi:multidrug efflux system outer membrane protein
MRRLAPFALAAAALLAGCIDLAPAYHRPAQPTPSQFPTGPAYAPASGPPQGVVGWRDFFSDPKLKTVIEEALANNRDLRVAVANIAAARAQYVVQRSDLFPKFNATVSAVYGQTPYSVLAAGAAGTTPKGDYNERLYNANVGVSAWQLDLFGKQRDLTRASFEQYIGTRAARDAAQISLVQQVAADYLAVGEDQALLAIARETLKSGGESLALTQARFKGGVASELDVSQAETIVDQAKFDQARLTTQLAQDRNALELVVGAPVPETLLPTDVDSPEVVLSNLPADLPSSALLARPDVVEAEAQLRGANANIGAARAAFFPDISLTASGGVTSLALKSLFKSAAETWSFAPTVTQPIFDAGQNIGNLRYAKAEREVSVAQYEKAVQTAFREVADALADRGTVEDRVAAQRALVAADALALKLSTARYERGADTYLNVLISQRSYFAAQEVLVAVELAKADNLVTLYTALGGGLDAPTAAQQAIAR